VIGTVLLVTCSVWWKIFPIASWGTLGDMILPALTLSLPFAAYIARLTRFGMIDQMNADYVRAARAKGRGRTAHRDQARAEERVPCPCSVTSARPRPWP
jgi:oligopeptide transport system permease protein